MLMLRFLNWTLRMISSPIINMPSLTTYVTGPFSSPAAASLSSGRVGNPDSAKHARQPVRPSPDSPLSGNGRPRPPHWPAASGPRWPPWVRVVAIIDLLPITIIDVSRGLQRAVVPVTSSLLSRIVVPFPLVSRWRNGERTDDLAQTPVDHGTSFGVEPQ